MELACHCSRRLSADSFGGFDEDPSACKAQYEMELDSVGQQGGRQNQQQQRGSWKQHAFCAHSRYWLDGHPLDPMACSNVSREEKTWSWWKFNEAGVNQHWLRVIKVMKAYETS